MGDGSPPRTEGLCRQKMERRCEKENEGLVVAPEEDSTKEPFRKSRCRNSPQGRFFEKAPPRPRLPEP
jgi:hypothetical protein